MDQPSVLLLKVLFFVILFGSWTAHVQGAGLLWTYDQGKIEGFHPTVAIAPDASTIVCANEGSITLLKPNGEKKWSGSYATFLAFSDDITHFVAANDRELQYFTTEGELLWMDSEWSPIRDIEITPEFGSLAVVAGGRTTVYDHRGNIRWYNRSSMVPMSVSISEDGAMTAVGYFKEIELFDSTGYRLANYSTYGAVNQIDLLSSEQYVIASDDNILMMFYEENLTPIWSFKTSGTIRDVAISTEPSFIAAGGDDHTLYLFNTTGALVWSYDTKGTINSVDIVPDGSKIVVGSNSEKVIVFDNQKHLLLYQPVDGFVKDTAFSKDGHYLAAVTVWGTVYFFDLEEPSPTTLPDSTIQPTPIPSEEERPSETSTTNRRDTPPENVNLSIRMTPIENRITEESQANKQESGAPWILIPLVSVIAGFIVLSFIIINSTKKR